MAARRPRAAAATSATATRKRAQPTARATASRTAPAAAQVSPRPPAAPVPGAGERVRVLAVPFEYRAVAAAAGATWHAGLRQHVHLGAALPASLTPFAAPDYSWERFVEDDLNTVATPVRSAVHRMRPRPHQVTAAQHIEASARRGYRGFVEADDVGLGKTIATWCGVLLLARARPVRTVLVMCPKGVVKHWRETVAAVGNRDGLRVVVVNYDRAKSLLAAPASAATAKRTATKNRRIAAQGTPRVDWDVVVFDESHKIKNADSQRTQAAARLARYASSAKDAPFVVWMSATLGQNPVELGYLAPLLAHITGAKPPDLSDFGQWLADQGFAVQYQARFKKWVWGGAADDATPSALAALERHKARDIARIHDLLFAGPEAPSIRRLPTDIAGWPEIQRVLHPITLDVGERFQYEQAWTAFRAERRLVRRGGDPRGPLAARTRFRQKASLLKVPGTVEQVLDLVDNGHQVAVSCEWLETIDALMAALSQRGVTVAEYTGRNEAQAEAERVAFQRGQRQVVLFNVAQAISLHRREDMKDGTVASDAPRSTVVHDPRYSGLDSIQIEGRAHRDGQNANVYYTYAEGTVEEAIVRTLVGRVRTTKAMQGDDVAHIAALEAMLDAAADADGDTPADALADAQADATAAALAATPVGAAVGAPPAVVRGAAPAVSAAGRVAVAPRGHQMAPVLHEPRRPVATSLGQALRSRG